LRKTDFDVSCTTFYEGSLLMKRDIAKYIDHTVLKPDVTQADIEKLCFEAKEYGFASVCVNPVWVETAANLLQKSDVKVCSVIGFPLGATTTEVKAYETTELVQKGAAELDMVINISALKDQRYHAVEEDIRAVVEAANGKALIKVIIETCLLNVDEKRNACELAVKAGADFVKTSTGFSTGGATVDDVKLMRAVVGPKFGVKASGGIRDYKTAIMMIEAGATRIGTSSGVAIIKGSER
jgi:deoxyribose-phosphate aldolase